MDPVLVKLAKTNFLYFFQGAWKVLYPHKPLELMWYHRAIIHLLSEMQHGRCLRSLINIMPRSLKSTIVSVMWTAYLLGRDPTERIMVLSYSDTLATDFTLLVRDLMLSPFYQAVFPKTVLAIKSSTYLRTTAGGERFAGSVTGTITGRGASWLIVDDPHSGSAIASPKKRKKALKIFQNTIATRLNDPRTDKLLFMGQRFHEDDVFGNLLERGGWHLLMLQARATVEQTIPIGSGNLHHVAIDDLLDPVRFSPGVLATYELDLGGTNFAAQMLQEPVPETGEIIKREWLVFQPAPFNRQGMSITLSIDTAIKGTTSADYSVCAVWGERDNYHYLLDIYRRKRTLPDLLMDIKQICANEQPETILIEDQGSGAPLGDFLSMAGIFPVMRPTGGLDKQTRLSKASYPFQQGRVVMPVDAPWLPETLSELFVFPNGKNDDIVDTISQYLNWVQERGVFIVHPSLPINDPEEGGFWDPMDWAYCR